MIRESEVMQTDEQYVDGQGLSPNPKVPDIGPKFVRAKLKVSRHWSQSEVQRVADHLDMTADLWNQDESSVWDPDSITKRILPTAAAL